MKTKWIPLVGSLVLVGFLGLSGCSTNYRTPGAAADLSELFNDADEDIQEIVSRKPASPMPANLVMLRLQDGEYWSYSCNGRYVRRGNYSIMTVRDIEEEKDFERIRAFGDVAQVGTLNRLLLPLSITSEKDLRVAAAKLRADMLFVYTVDTKYWSEDMARPLSVVTLGLSPNVNLHMISTLSGVLYDVRTGFVYGAVEATEKQKQITSWWANSDSADQARLRVERIAFDKMLDEFEKLWIGVAAEQRALTAY
jgi:hypothetical protein